MNKLQLPYDVYDDRCPTRDVLSRLADKWALLVLGCLEKEPQRFNSLRRHIRGITQKMLTQTLRKLERDGLVSRKIPGGACHGGIQFVAVRQNADAHHVVSDTVGRRQYGRHAGGPGGL